MPGGTNRLLVGKLESWINYSIDVIKIEPMFLLRYPKQTIWHDRNNLPEPHIWRTDPLNSFSMKETQMTIFIIVFVLVFVFLFWKFPQHKYKFVVVIISFLIGFILFPLTSLMGINLFITSFTRTPSIHLDKNLYFPQAFDLETPETFEKIKRRQLTFLKTRKIYHLRTSLRSLTTSTSRRIKLTVMVGERIQSKLQIRYLPKLGKQCHL